MKAINRACKVSALTHLLRGNDRPARALRSPLIIDLDQFSIEEIEVIQRLQQAYYAGNDTAAQLTEFDRLFGDREIRMIPQPTYPTFKL